MVYAAIWCWIAPGWANRLGPAIGYRWGMLFVVAGAIFLLQEVLWLPLSFYSGYLLEHRYELSNETRRGWLIRQGKELLVSLVLGGIVLAGLYGLLWYGGPWWWAWTWIGWVGLSVGLTQLFPVLILPIFYKSVPIDDEGLIERLKRLAEGAGLRIAGVFRLDLSSETKKPNAMLAGLGATRRVLLSDTLLEAFDPAEIETVFAHELGHHVRGHVWKGIAMSAVGATAVIAGVAWRLGPYAGRENTAWVHATAALPQVILVVEVVGLVLRPIVNAILRAFEMQCDRDALKATGPDAYRSAFRKLADMSLADPEPSRWVEVLFYDHPPVSRRLALADEPASAGASPPAT